MGDHADVVVQRVDFNLQVTIVIQQRRVAISSSFQLLPHIHDLVLLGSDLGLQFLDVVGQVNVATTLRVDSLLQVHVLVSVLLLQGPEVVQFVLEANDLVFELDDLALAVDELGFFVLQVEGLGVYELVEVVDTGKLLGDVVLKGSGLGS